MLANTDDLTVNNCMSYGFKIHFVIYIIIKWISIIFQGITVQPDEDYLNSRHRLLRNKTRDIALTPEGNTYKKVIIHFLKVKSFV